MESDKILIEKIKLATKVIERSLAYKAYINEIPALAFGIVYKDKLIFSKGFGFADLEKKVKVDEQTCFRIASISKIFTATAIMQLVEQNKLRLDDNVSDHLDWFRSGKDKNVERITIRQLLTHTSGIQRDGDTPHWVNHNFPTLDHLKKYVSDLVLPYEPNVSWKYSNFGFAILGEVIRLASGEESYEAYIKKNITEKLKMNLTCSVLTEEIKARLAIGRGRKIPGKQREIFPQIETNTYASATGFTSNISDLSKFISTWFKGNNVLLTEESKRELFRIQWLREDEYHQAVAFKTWKMDSRTYHSHSGGFPGYRTNITFDKERQIGAIMLTNIIGIDPSSYSQLILHTIDYAIKNIYKFNDEMDKKVNLSKYEGSFTNHWNDLEVVILNKKLIIYDPSIPKPLSGYAGLEFINDKTFRILSKKWEKDREITTFQFDSVGKVREIIVGPTPYKKVNLY